MAIWAYWVGFGLLAMGAELLVPGAFLAWIGAAAVGTGLAVLFLAPGFPATVLIFIILLALGIALSLRFFRPGPKPSALNTPDSGLVGRVGILLSTEGDRGRARIGDSEWPVRLSGKAEAGTRVVVTAVEGMTLLVRPEG
ncbi:nodulation efficiency protein D [Acetobacteraceae bacterium AT-5844]|nr:nodulation efficiency protein D [Acetobacteraceae bacterium AT-5844]